MKKRTAQTVIRTNRKILSESTRYPDGANLFRRVCLNQWAEAFAQGDRETKEDYLSQAAFFVMDYKDVDAQSMEEPRFQIPSTEAPVELEVVLAPPSDLGATRATSPTPPPPPSPPAAEAESTVAPFARSLDSISEM